MAQKHSASWSIGLDRKEGDSVLCKDPIVTYDDIQAEEIKQEEEQELEKQELEKQTQYSDDSALEETNTDLSEEKMTDSRLNDLEQIEGAWVKIDREVDHAEIQIVAQADIVKLPQNEIKSEIVINKKKLIKKKNFVSKIFGS